jgi:hypothetical protein
MQQLHGVLGKKEKRKKSNNKGQMNLRKNGLPKSSNTSPLKISNICAGFINKHIDIYCFFLICYSLFGLAF